MSLPSSLPRAPTPPNPWAMGVEACGLQLPQELGREGNQLVLQSRPCGPASWGPPETADRPQHASQDRVCVPTVPYERSTSRDTSITERRGPCAAAEGTCVLRADEGHLVGVRLQADEATLPVHRLPRVRVEGVEPGGHQGVSAGAAREQGTACSLTWKQPDKGHHGALGQPRV